MNIHKNINFFKYAEHAQLLLSKEGICFAPNGFPNLTCFTYVKTLPEDIEVWPYNKRNQARNPSKTILTTQFLYYIKSNLHRICSYS